MESYVNNVTTARRCCGVTGSRDDLFFKYINRILVFYICIQYSMDQIIPKLN